MNKSFPIFFRLCFVFFALCGTTSKAQPTQDFESRTNIAADYDPAKNFSIGARYRLTLQDNSTRFKRSMFSVDAAYDVLKWLRIGGEYRYNTAYNQDFHRWAFYARLDEKIGKWSIKYRAQYQQAQDYFNTDYLEVFKPVRVFRNKFWVGYPFTKKIGVFVYAESFSRLKNQEFNWYRMRYGAGANYLYKRRQTISAEVFVNDEFNLKKPEDRVTAELGYAYHFTKKKKKKKHKKHKKVQEGYFEN